MDLFGANPVDVVVLVVITVSALLALVRGFVAEVLAIVAWITAIAVTAYGTGPTLPHVESYMGSGLTSMAITVGALFCGTLAIMSALSYAASRFMRNNHLSAIDRSMGFLFGMVRGGLLVCLIYICVVFVFPLPNDGEDPEPNTMQEVMLEARLQPVLASGASFLQALAPNNSLAVDDLTNNPLIDLVHPTANEKDDNDATGTNTPQGYSLSARDGLSALIGQINGLREERE